MKSEKEVLEEHGFRNPPSNLKAFKESKLKVGQNYPIIIKNKGGQRRKMVFQLKTLENKFGKWRIISNSPA